MKRPSDYSFPSSSPSIVKRSTKTPSRPTTGSPSETCSVAVLNTLEAETIDSAVGEDGANRLGLDTECILCASRRSGLSVGGACRCEGGVSTNDCDSTSLVKLLVDGKG